MHVTEFINSVEELYRKGSQVEVTVAVDKNLNVVPEKDPDGVAVTKLTFTRRVATLLADGRLPEHTR